MEHIAALLLLVSCSQDLSGCREVEPRVAVFEVYEDCQAELPKAIGEFAPKYPRLFAKCLEVDPALEDDYNELAWNVQPDGTLQAELRVTNVVSASVRPEKDYVHEH